MNVDSNPQTNCCFKTPIWKTGSTSSICIGCSNNNTAANSRLWFGGLAVSLDKPKLFNKAFLSHFREEIWSHKTGCYLHLSSFVHTEAGVLFFTFHSHPLHLQHCLTEVWKATVDKRITTSYWHGVGYWWNEASWKYTVWAMILYPSSQSSAPWGMRLNGFSLRTLFDHHGCLQAWNATRKFSISILWSLILIFSHKISFKPVCFTSRWLTFWVFWVKLKATSLKKNKVPLCFLNMLYQDNYNQIKLVYQAATSKNQEYLTQARQRPSNLRKCCIS